MRMTPRIRALLLPLTLAVGCGSAALAPGFMSAPPASPVCDLASQPEEAPVEVAVSAAPEDADLRPGRYWFLNGDCRTLDVRVVQREGGTEFTEYALRSDGGTHSSEGTVFYLGREGALMSGGFRRSGLSLEHACNAARQPLSASRTSFAGVHLFDDLASCEAQECTEDACLARFSLRDCPSSVATSVRKLRRITHPDHADEASRQRTLLRFQRLGRRGRLWMDSESECVAVEARRDGADLDLHYSELVEGRRGDFTANYSVSPLDLRAVRGESTILFTGGGEQQTRPARGWPNVGVGLYFGDGEVLLGEKDLFFDRSACEANHAANLARR